MMHLASSLEPLEWRYNHNAPACFYSYVAIEIHSYYNICPQIMKKMTTNDTVTCYFLSVTLVHSRDTFVASVITSVLNSFLSVTAVFGNAFVISVIWRREVLHVPSNILLCCLATSDLVVGLISQPAFVIYKVAEIKGYFNVYCAARMFFFCSGWLFSGVSLLTMCAISVDRYLALKLHLRYTAVVTVTRVLATVIGFWLVCAISITLRLVMENTDHWNIIPLGILLISLLVIMVAFSKAFKIVRRHQRQIHDRFELAAHFHGRSAVEVARHKKSAVTMLYILGAFLLCYVPFLGTIITERVLGYTLPVKIAYECTATVVFFSSSLNPPLYCWRIREIRRVASSTLDRVITALQGRIPTFHIQKIADREKESEMRKNTKEIKLVVLVGQSLNQANCHDLNSRK